MKKLIALISAIAVVCTMSLTSFAAITVTPNGAVTGVALAPGATSGYDASYESTEVNTQTTIVAVKGTEINTSSIQYINQLEQDSETTINFDLKDTLAADEIVTVYMGGDAIDKTKIGTIACVADAPTKYTVTFKNGDTVLTTAQYDEGTTGVTYSGETPTKADDETYTYTFAGWLDSETQADVDLATLKVTKDITLIAKFDATPIPSGGEDEYTYDVALQNVTYNGTPATVVRITGLDPAAVAVTVDGTVANYYVRTTDSANVIVACIEGTYTEADAVKALVSITDGTTETIIFGDCNYNVTTHVYGDGNTTSADGKEITYSAAGATTTGRGGRTYTLPTDLMTLFRMDVTADGNISSADGKEITYSAAGATTTGRGGKTYSITGMNCYNK